MSLNLTLFNVNDDLCANDSILTVLCSHTKLNLYSHYIHCHTVQFAVMLAKVKQTCITHTCMCKPDGCERRSKATW